MDTLLINIGTHQQSMVKAFKDVSRNFEVIDWTRSPLSLFERVEKLLHKGFKPDLTFMQIQTPNIVTPALLKSLPGIKVNWTGDVRDHTPSWMIKLAPLFDLTCFSNQDDVLSFNKYSGGKARFLNIGFEESIFKPEGKTQSSLTPVVFMANNYINRFPLSEFRTQIVKNFPIITAYGNNWGKLSPGSLMNNPEGEAAIYRGAKLAICISHYSRERYFSDRVLRAMACGCPCLIYRYPGMRLDFDEESNCIGWSNEHELQTYIKFFLKREDLRSQIAENGKKLVWEKHRWSNRVQELLSFPEVVGAMK